MYLCRVGIGSCLGWLVLMLGAKIDFTYVQRACAILRIASGKVLDLH